MEKRIIKLKQVQYRFDIFSDAKTYAIADLKHPLKRELAINR